ncbi:MAG: right-handed parallel beta-helix repeat-containing protein, partial [Ignavibacteriae bacterium]|nr:right-handed parallel beta-helix repeat-containing protein [Ignavibacteriota bacterium]
MKTLFVTLILCMNVAFSQTLLHPWSVIDFGGGAVLSDNGLQLLSSMGQPAVQDGAVGNYRLVGGFVPGTSYLTSTFVVTNTNNNGAGSLKQAIFDANENPGLDFITFNIAPGGHQVIHADSVLPEITDSVIIDATTQPGYAGLPLIEIDGTNAGVRQFSYGGLLISSGSTTIRGLVINKFATDGIYIIGEGYNVIEGCYIGTDSLGMADSGNAGSGITILNSPHNLIGGTTANARNVISGNESVGIWVYGYDADSNVIQGNYIGVNRTGTAAIPNYVSGIVVSYGD